MAPLFTLYTATSPNGQKPALILEELKAAYPSAGLEYDVRVLTLSKFEQKEPWYLKINPNGRVPALVHHRPNGTDFAVFESSAIISYLVQRFDPEHKFSFPVGSDWESEALQWIFFAHGGVAPSQGQAAYFQRAAPEKIPFVIDRFVNETNRVFSVLEERLKDRDWLVGPDRGTYSIADINVWPWVKSHALSGPETLDEFPNLHKWVERIRGRKAAQIAIEPPQNTVRSEV